MRWSVGSTKKRWRRSDRALAVRGAQRGVAVVELALIMPILAMIIFSAVDLGRTASYYNRMSNAAREGASVAQFTPEAVNSGCNRDRNIVDRVRKQNESLATATGYKVTVAKKNTSTGALTPYTGCTTTTPALSFAPGDRVVITVTVDLAMSGPASAVVVGNTARLQRSIELVVQG